MRYLFILLHFILCCSSCAQERKANVKTTSWSYRLGDGNIHIKYAEFDTVQSYIIVQLHGNEISAIEAARLTLQEQGGALLTIDNRDRNISFRLHGKRYTFDPNRMFSRKGIRESLQTYGNYSAAAIDAVAAFAGFFLSKIPDSAIIIAVHNNSDQRFSAASYRKDPEYRNVAAAVHLNEVLDTDNFFLLTDEELYRKIRYLDYNAVLQNNSTAPDDGSLSIYCGRRSRNYINIEAQAGETATQQTMLEELIRMLKEGE